MPVKGPVVVGEKVTLIVQEPLAATLLPQLLVWPKLVLVAKLVIVSAPPPELLRVIGCDALVVPRLWLLKVRLGEERPATGAVPVPVSAIVWGVTLALSVTVIEPLLVPIIVGVKVTLMLQLEPVNELPQLFVWAKSPEAVMLEMRRVPSPVMVNVTAWGPLVVPTFCGPNVRLVTEMLNTAGEILATNASLCPPP